MGGGATPPQRPAQAPAAKPMALGFNDRESAGTNQPAHACALIHRRVLRWRLGVWVIAVQPLPHAMSKVVRLVRTMGGHRDHFLAQMHSYLMSQLPLPRSRYQRGEIPYKEANVLECPHKAPGSGRLAARCGVSVGACWLGGGG